MIDTLGIQSYVFVSNQLTDIIAGSLIVETYTSQDYIQSFKSTETEIIFAGGGNALLKFSTLEMAKEFSAQYSRSLLEVAPGLRIAIVHLEYSEGNFGQAFQKIQIRMQQAKTQQSISSPLLGISVNESCRETGLPATNIIAKKPVSKDIARRRELSSKLDDRWMIHIPDDWRSIIGCDSRYRLAFPESLHDLGRTKDDLSMIGVIHVDGNQIGTKLNNLIREWANAGINDDEIISRIRAVSSGLTNGLNCVLDTLFTMVLGSIYRSEDNGFALGIQNSANGFELHTKGNTLFLPIRPVLRAGDDITLISDARISLSLAEIAVRSFQEQIIPYLTDLSSITASAGVSIGGMQIPLHRAYERSEELCKSAKNWIRLRDYDGGSIDWNIDYSNAVQPLSIARELNYGPITDSAKNEYQFTLKPYPLQGNFEEGYYSWEWLSKCVLSRIYPGFLSDIWSGSRNKLRELREIIREGSSVVESRLTAWRVANDALKFPQGIENGFIGSRTPILDALELLNLWLPLDGDDLK